MKRLFCLMSIFVLIIFSGCNTNRNTNYVNPDKASKETIKQIVDHLSNDDTEGLKGMFCEKIKISDSLDDELNQAMEFFEGKIDSYDDLTTPNREKIEDGRQVEVRISPSINVTTTTGQTYEIRLNSCLVNVEDEEKVGISEIHMKRSDGKEINIGNYYIVNPISSD